MKISKKAMAERLGYEYLGKGFDNAGDDGYIIRKIGTTNLTIIGYTQEQAHEWLTDKLNMMEEE